MSTAAAEPHIDDTGDDHTGHDHTGHDHTGHSDHRPDIYYIKVAVVLAALTGLETSTYWIDFGPAFMPALLIMMSIKFLMVVSLFMHLKFDNRIFSYLFYSGLLLAIGVYLAALATFRFFGSG